jgi:transcription antitermination protein NusB
MASPRRRAREMALLALYEMDVAAHDPSTALERLCDTHSLKPEQRDFARTLLAGVLAGITEIDGVIERTAPQWPAQQLSPVDRNILRVAIREFLVDNLTPAGAAINEAVDLAKKYGSENSGRFVNGVLGSVSTSGRPLVQEGN